MRRRLLAEFVGTALLVTVVVGSGIAAQTLSPHDIGLQLLENSLATVAGLSVLILVLGPVSGAHFNPVVTAVDAFLSRTGMKTVAAYTGAQCVGAIAGAVLANAMFARPLVALSTHHRGAPHLWLAEIVATAGLVGVIVALARNHKAAQTAWAVGAYIGAAYWFTSSTSFANPAVTLGRAFTNTFAGIAPVSVPGYVLAQVVGAAVGLALVLVLYPTHDREEVLVDHS